MKIRVEASCLTQEKLSGVGRYTELLTNNLAELTSNSVSASYMNFLNKHPSPTLSKKIKLEPILCVPQKVYAKTQSYGLPLPFDLFLPKVDVTIFPNFINWCNAKSSITATVIHDLTFLRYPEMMEEKNLAHLKRSIKRTIKKSDLIITVSNTIKKELSQNFDLAPEKCFVTHIPPNVAVKNNHTEDVHKKYNIPTKNYLLFLGNLEPRKDIPTLVESFSKLPQKIKNNFSLVIAGNRGWRVETSEKAITQAQEKGDNVIQPGFIAGGDLPSLYAKSFLFVMPSIYEGFGMPVLEAFSHNTAVLASDIEVLREVGGDSCLYAKPGDAQDFSKKITMLINNPTEIDKLKIKAKKQLATFSWQNTIAELSLEFTNILKNKTS